MRNPPLDLYHNVWMSFDNPQRQLQIASLISASSTIMPLVQTAFRFTAMMRDF